MNAVMKLTDRFTETTLDDEIVLMRIDNGEFFAMADTAAAIWRLIDGRRTSTDLQQKLGEEFDLDEERTAHDVEAFLSTLKEAGLIADR